MNGNGGGAESPFVATMPGSPSAATMADTRGPGHAGPPAPCRPVAALLASVLLLAACGGRASAPVPRPFGAEPEPRLPEIPARDGALDIRVAYPEPGAALAVRDSTFVFGAVGTGRASLRINGTAVPVERNGAFLAFLPVPPDGVYRFRAAAAAAAADTTVTVRLPDAPPPPRPGAAILSGTAYPTGAIAALPTDRIEVGFRGTAGGEAWLELPYGARIPLTERTAIVGPGTGARRFAVEPEEGAAGLRGWSDYAGSLRASPMAAVEQVVPQPQISEAPVRVVAAGPGRLLLVADGDTATATLPLNLVVLDPRRPRVGIASDTGLVGVSGDGEIIARPGPGPGPYHWFWPNGTELTVTGQRNDQFRIRLTEDLSVWTPTEQIRMAPPGTPPPESRIGSVRFRPAPEHVDIHIPMTRRLPFRIDQAPGRVSITVYGGVAQTNFLQHGRLDPLIERAEWHQPTADRFRLDVLVGRRPWGYDAFHAGNGDLVVRLRRPPALDPGAPLRGLTIAVDAGHGGALPSAPGPTGLTEGEANLAVATKLRARLEERGARVVMIREGEETLGLLERMHAAERADAHLLVSVHNNAFPDGVNPFENNGTSVYYFHPHSAELARTLQGALLAELGLRDLGIGRADLALTRPTWMPAVLTETMFMMVPRHEAALRDPSVQDRIARAHVRGIEAFLRASARADR